MLRPSAPVVPKHEHVASESSGGFFETQVAVPQPPRVSGKQDLRICISNRCPGEADLAGSEATHGESPICNNSNEHLFRAYNVAPG